jgi:hypothetical protein
MLASMSYLKATIRGLSLLVTSSLSLFPSKPDAAQFHMVWLALWSTWSLGSNASVATWCFALRVAERLWVGGRWRLAPVSSPPRDTLAGGRASSNSSSSPGGFGKKAAKLAGGAGRAWDDWELQAVAARGIGAGEELFISYADQVRGGAPLQSGCQWREACQV